MINAKIISYKNLEKARAKRNIKKAAKVNKKEKRGRKQKSPAPEADALESKAKVARTSEAPELVRAPLQAALVARIIRDCQDKIA
ncbi:hypothetical protein AOQ84DRAFT_379354 [Glonium stellatum]|uniref:Uncharacterized protein n=1 Tax=Glonium stellatum TaxID=574774 RepID=A0A8E2JQE2_9PEZI|nr:hypothetical protein AOQ84DRAFT_379354 [Glonium stellatum]